MKPPSQKKSSTILSRLFSNDYSAGGRETEAGQSHPYDFGHWRDLTTFSQNAVLFVCHTRSKRVKRFVCQCHALCVLGVSEVR
jgi:hypothetical protein